MNVIGRADTTDSPAADQICQRMLSLRGVFCLFAKNTTASIRTGYYYIIMHCTD